MTPPGSGALPNLVVIGAQKCGTTSLHRYLDVHPEISMSRPKETDFFLADGNWDRGLGWYARHFDPDSVVRGESSPNYTSLPASTGTPKRMHGVVPDAKLIYLVRNPLERISSHYVHARAGGVERRSFSEAISDPKSDYLARSRFATQLKAYRRWFPAQQVLVETQERFLDDRNAVLGRIFRFLEVDDAFRSPEFDRLWEQTAGKGAGYSLAFRLSKSTNISVPKRLRWPLQRLLRRRLGGRTIERPDYDERLLERVRTALEGETDELRELTGLRLTSWTV